MIGSGTAQARPSHELIREAKKVESISDSLRSEFRSHFRDSGGYSALRSDLSKIRMKADHIGRQAHGGISKINILRRGVSELSSKSYHLSRVVGAIEAGKYSGCVYGNTREVHELLASLNYSIQSMGSSLQEIGRNYRDHRNENVTRRDHRDQDVNRRDHRDQDSGRRNERVESRRGNNERVDSARDRGDHRPPHPAEIIGSIFRSIHGS